MERELKDSDGLEIMRFLYSRRKIIITATFFCALASILITSFIPKKYKSSAVFFPPSFNKSVDQSTISPQMGFNWEADRLIQMAQSSALKDSLIEEFNLIVYYEIDTIKDDWRDKIYKVLNKDLVFERTKYMSVVISAETKVPELSSKIANSTLALLSRFWERLYKDNIIEPLSYAQDQYMDKNAEVSELLDSIHLLRSGNKEQSLEMMYKQLKSKEAEIQTTVQILNSIREAGEFYDYGEQIDISQLELINIQQEIEQYKGRIGAFENAKFSNDTMMMALNGRLDGALKSEVLLQNRITNLKANGKDFESMMKKLEIDMLQYQIVKSNYENLLNAFEPYVRSLELENLELKYKMERQNLIELKNKYEHAYRYFNQPLPNLFVVENAKPSYRKASPSYRFNLLIATIAGFIFTCILLLFLDKFRQMKESMSE